MNSQRRVAMHVAPRTVNRSFLLELERDETAQRAERMKENLKTAALT
jgi:hypothetical protein